ncbi:LIM homeobox transcription factor 1-alpha [Anopheles bellator]|uniref:LIM homeobox transcription factor 1-alpha n=1 Tax=Anopheles bellator TaxID=139047 RepID=UPI0026476549|nr:LIM homeobox transcription factor 1-alpha [Anopheles bellator]
MIDQQPKLPYFPMEMKCNLVGPVGQDESRPPGCGQPMTSEPGGSVGGTSERPASNMATTTTTISSCSAKTPITANASPQQQQQHHQPAPPATNAISHGSVTASPASLGQDGRILLAAAAAAAAAVMGSENDVGGGAPGAVLGSSLCGQCCSPICDRYIMKVVDITYHERCLQCTSCSIRLMHSCFMRDGKLYCRFDYERLYGRNRCLGCGEKIGADELVMRALDNVFHLKCFICVVCGVRLQKGDQYVIKQSQLFCRPDYEKEVEMFQGYNYDEYCCDDIFQTRIDGRRGPKRPRTILTTQQRRAFKASFDISPKPCRKIREGLAKDTGLSIRIVQVWFQNQRAKMKKIQKKQLKEGTKGGHHGAGSAGGANGSKNHNGSSSKGHDSPDELSDGEGHGKLSLRIKDENSRSNNYLHDSCSDNEGTVTDNDGTYGGPTAGGRLLGGPDPFKIVKEELDFDVDYFRLAMPHHHHHSVPGRYGGKSFGHDHQMGPGGCSGIKTENMTSLDTSLTAVAEMEYHGVPLQQLASAMNGAGSPHGMVGGPTPASSTPGNPPMPNPIDRLYSMQNSYFCNQENPLPAIHGHCGGPQHQLQNQMQLQSPHCPSMTSSGGPLALGHTGHQHHFASNNNLPSMALGASTGHHGLGLCGAGLEPQPEAVM